MLAFSALPTHITRSSRCRTAARRTMYPWLAASAMNRARETTAHVATLDSLESVGDAARCGLWKRKTRAELVRAESQERKERQSSQGPIESVRFESGRRKCVTSLNASERNSTILLSRAITEKKRDGRGVSVEIVLEIISGDRPGASGQMGDRRAT